MTWWPIIWLVSSALSQLLLFFHIPSYFSSKANIWTFFSSIFASLDRLHRQYQLTHLNQEFKRAHKNHQHHLHKYLQIFRYISLVYVILFHLIFSFSLNFLVRNISFSAAQYHTAYVSHSFISCATLIIIASCEAYHGGFCGPYSFDSAILTFCPSSNIIIINNKISINGSYQ